MATAAATAAAMPLGPSLSRDKNETIGENYDRLYAESWEAALAHCESTLETDDHSRALKVKTADDFRTALRQLQIEHPDQRSGEIISMLFPVVEHYEVFAKSFVTMMAHAVDVSMLWGLLYLVIKLSLGTRGTVERIHRMLRAISNKLEQLNEIFTTVSDFTKFKAHVFEINREIFMLWLNVIMVFRTQYKDDDPDMVEELKEKFDSLCNTTEKQVESLVKHIQEMTLIAGRQSQMVDLSKYYNALALQQESKPITLPCHTIPVPRNLRFFGRENILQQIDAHFSSSSALSGMSSLAIYGLGGVGKSQIALEYAWKKQAELDVVLWIPAESQIAIQQALSHAATTALNLNDADPTSHNKNAVLVMQWLRTTDAKWLLVFDNVETPLIFETYWPVSNHGSILVTTRKLGLTTQPIIKNIELDEFNPEQGARFLTHNLPGREVSTEGPEFETALAISSRLSGHALAISQMTALIIAKGFSLEKFLIMYDKHSKKMHRERKSGWKYPGYEHAIDTLWELSFSSLDQDSRVCLGILSFLEPDSIPQELFGGSPISLEHPALKFCEDEYSQSEVFESLANFALIRINHNSETISIHRLVQAEFLFQMTADDRQEEFDATILLLLDQFPSRGESLVDEENWAQAERYLPQVLVALQKFRDSQKEQEPLKPSLNLLNLICDALWYLATNDSAGNRDVVLNIAYLAWDKWDSKEEAPLVHAYILARGSDQDLWNGEFNNGLQKIRDALNIALKYLEPDNERVLQYNSDYGIAFGSAGDYKRGANYLGRAEEFFNQNPQRYGIAKGILINANISRNSYCNGDYEDAGKRLTRTLEMTKEMGSLYWEVLIHFAFISLGLRSGDLILANNHLVLADDAIRKFGRGRNIQLNGMYNYFAGRVRLDQARVRESIDFFEKSIAIDDIQLTPRGYRARHLYALSRAQAALPSNEALSVKTEAEALKLAGNIVLEGEGDHWDAFDLLIRIVER